MSKSKATNIVRLDWLSNRTPTGRRSATKARKLAQYFALGRGREKEQQQQHPRGQWLDQAGRPCSHEEVLQWVRRQGMSHEMTYQFILSVKETQLSDGAFNRAMAAGGPLFSEWRLISHDDSRYPHAHALAFGNQPVQIKSEAFQSWWRAVRQALEREQASAREMQQEAALEQERAAVLQQEAGLVQDGAEREQATQLEEQLETTRGKEALEREQDHDQGWGMEL
ncbi:MAG: hypothetical protein IT327_32105 [Anaerolineae bacterium]|nr:hypothetical protein [Anaerolineae bacterium]